MGSKKYKAKQCVYCQGPSSTGDHIFAREFFLVNKRQNIPIVPSCLKCNSNKSIIESYLSTVLPFGGRHSDALENLKYNGPRRLKGNARLGKEIRSSVSTIWAQDGGIIQLAKTIDIDHSQLINLFDLVTKALVFHHFKINVANCVLSTTLDLDYSYHFKNPAKQEVNIDIGSGTINYRGRQAEDNEYSTLWEYTVYGGLNLGHGPQNIYSITLPG